MSESDTTTKTYRLSRRRFLAASSAVALAAACGPAAPPGASATASAAATAAATPGKALKIGQLLPFTKGGLLALDMEAPILPITIQGTRDVLPAHGMLSRKGAQVHVTIHPPVDTALFKAASSSRGDVKVARDELMKHVHQSIGSAL